MTVLLLTATLSAAWTVSFADGKDDLYRNNQVNKMLEKQTQRAGALIEDDGFYRVDQARHVVKLPANETLWWQTRSVYGYNSRIPSDVLEFNGLVGNNYGYSKRVAVLSNDNRAGLDQLCAVKYFLGDDTKNGKSGSDEFAGYCFDEYKTIDGVRVFRNRYDVSLGYVFDRCISESEFRKLGYAEREQALLQAVVLPDGTDIPDVRRAEAADIRTAVKEVGYTVSGSKDASLRSNTIVTDKAGGYVILEPETVENSQLLVSFTGLHKKTADGQDGSFIVYVDNGFVEKKIDNRITNQSIPGVKDFNLNLGYYENLSGGQIKISFSSPGTYTFDDLKLYAMDAVLFDECMERMGSSRYVIDSFSDTEIEGTVDSADGGILFLSIIEPERWECFVDGKQTEIIKNTDIAFTGAAVPAGHHTVTLRFRNRMSEMGIMLSVSGLIILAAAMLIRRRHGMKGQESGRQ